MNERPAVPNELRRRILVEAGHRCAIHTCQHPDVDIHHIVPWEQCQKHEYDNLIALCPNCHRRADAGDIDRLSLKLYKARVVAAFGIFDEPEIGSKTAPAGKPDGAWKTSTIREQPDDSLYEVGLEFPEFSGKGLDIADLNVMLRADALQRLADIRSLRIAGIDDPFLWESKIPNALTSSYEVACHTEKIISVRHTFFHYGRGAAHPNHWTAVTNVQLGPLIPLQFSDLFLPKTGFLSVISDFCVAQLTAGQALTEPSDWIRRGAGADLKNFSKFNITHAGLLITFDEYQVDCHAAGSSQVLVPRNLLVGLLNPRCSVSNLWL
jgi:hypothetical protein